MIKIENVEVVGWEAAIRGMRNPMNSWDKSDTDWTNDVEIIYSKDWIDYDNEYGCAKVIGDNDHKLMMKLAKGGSVHAKYRRMIVVYADITAPLYWWKEFDTYKVGTVANSCSTMHKIGEKRFAMEDFSVEHLTPTTREAFRNTILRTLNEIRDCYLGFDGFKHKIGNLSKKDYWWQMIQLLPSSYNQRRTVMMNYEMLSNVYTWRRDHKLDEWKEFCRWIEKLPSAELITSARECIRPKDA